MVPTRSDVSLLWVVSNEEGIAHLQELHSTGVDLYLHQQGINTTTPAGKALFGVMGVFAEFERGKVEDRIRELRAQGLGMLKIAKNAGCGVSVVQRVLAVA